MPRDSRGRFTAGPDPDRHELTTEERRRGYYTALAAAGGDRGRGSSARAIWLFRVVANSRRRPRK